MGNFIHFCDFWDVYGDYINVIIKKQKVVACNKVDHIKDIGT